MLVAVCGVGVGMHVDGTEVVEAVLVAHQPQTHPAQGLDPGEAGRPGGPVLEGGRGGHADHSAGWTGRACWTRGTGGDLGQRVVVVVVVAILPVTIIKHGC